MNSLTIIGNLTGDPEKRTTKDGRDVCTFTVAVNRRGKSNTADFFRVSAWEEKGKHCKQFLSKGKKVAVTGPVSVHVYTKENGEPGATLEVQAFDVEFLSPKDGDEQNGYTRVNPAGLPY